MSSVLTNGVSFQLLLFPQKVSDIWSDNLMSIGTLILWKNLPHKKQLHFFYTIFYLRPLSNVLLHEYRNSHKRCFVKKDILNNLANFTGKHVRWSLFLITLQALQHRCFHAKFANFLRAPILKNICLNIIYFEEHLWTTPSVRKYSPS